MRNRQDIRSRKRKSGCAAVALLILAGTAVAGCRPDSATPPSIATDVDRLYAEGCERLRRLDGVGAHDRLAEAVASDPGDALAHAALAEAWTLLGYDDKATAAAEIGLAHAAGLSASERRIVEGRLHAARYDWEAAIESFGALFARQGDNVDYGYWLAGAQVRHGELEAALATVAKLRRLPPPASEDPRIELAEASARLDLGDARAARAAAERALAAGRTAGAPLVVAYARLWQALALQEQGTGAGVAVLVALEEAREIFQDHGNRRGLALVLDLSASTLQAQGELKRARRLFDEALAVYREIGDRLGEAAVLGSLGPLVPDSDRPELYRAALALYEESDDHYRIATGEYNIGFDHHSRGDLDLALDHYRTALELYQEMGAVTDAVDARAMIAEIHFLRGELTTARTMHEQVVAYHRGSGDEVETGYNRYRLGYVYAARGDIFQARDHYQLALAAQARLGDVVAQAEIRTALADLLLAAGDAESAGRLALRAEEVLLLHGAVGKAARAGATLALAMLEQDKPAAARAAAVQARDLAAASDDRELRHKSALTDALVLAIADGARAAARARLDALRENAARDGLVLFAREADLAARKLAQPSLRVPPTQETEP